MLFSLYLYYNLDYVGDQKVRDIIFEAFPSPSERNQNIQDNPENFCREYVVDKRFMYDRQKKGPAVKDFGVFSKILIKLHFQF